MVTEEEFRRRAQELVVERIRGIRSSDTTPRKIRVKLKKEKPEKVFVRVVSKKVFNQDEVTMDALTMYTPEEKNEYKKNIKHRCFICGYAYKNNFLQYLVRGNCCTPCNVRIASYLKKTISRAECDLQLVERIKLLKTTSDEIPN